MTSPGIRSAHGRLSSPISSSFTRGTCFPIWSWNGASWFVSVEFLLCLLFPLYLALSRGGWRVALLLIAGGAAALALLAHPRYGLDLTFHNGIYRGISGVRDGRGICRASPSRASARRGIIAGSGFLARATGDPRLPLVRDLPYGLVASACGHLHSSFRHRACFRSVVRPRLSRQGAGDADSAQGSASGLTRSTSARLPFCSCCATPSCISIPHLAISCSAGHGQRGRMSGIGSNRRCWLRCASCGARFFSRSSNALPIPSFGVLVRGATRPRRHRLDRLTGLGHHSPAPFVPDGDFP